MLHKLYVTDANVQVHIVQVVASAVYSPASLHMYWAHYLQPSSDIFAPICVTHCVNTAQKACQPFKALLVNKVGCLKHLGSIVEVPVDDTCLCSRKVE